MKKLLRAFKARSILAIAFVTMLYACYPGGAEYVSDQDLVATEYNVDYYDGENMNKFNDWKTYYMPDTVSFQSNDDEAELSPAEQKAITDAFALQFSSRNYTRITDTVGVGAPDFAVNIQVLAVNNSGATWIPPLWPPYPPGWGWGPGWGWYPPGYWVPYSYTTGTIIAFLSDPNNPVMNGGEEEVPLAWRSVFNGLVSGTSSNNSSRIDRSIKQAFIQSPYIESTK